MGSEPVGAHAELEGLVGVVACVVHGTKVAESATWGQWGGGRGTEPVSGGGSLTLSALPPVIVVGLLVFAWNLLGDALNDVLNPRSR